MDKKFLGQICCVDCEKVIGHFPLDAIPKEDLTLYCDECVEKEEDNGKD